MDLPSAADSIINILTELKTSTANIPEKLDGIANTVFQPLYEKVNQLETEIRGNDYLDFIRQEVQSYHDLVLDQKIREISTHFNAELEQLKKRCNNLENLPDPSYVRAELQTEGQGVEDTVSNPGNEAESNPATKRSTKGRAPS
jgi:uncharacterized protein YukE